MRTIAYRDLIRPCGEAECLKVYQRLGGVASVGDAGSGVGASARGEGGCIANSCRREATSHALLAETSGTELVPERFAQLLAPC